MDILYICWIYEYILQYILWSVWKYLLVKTIIMKYRNQSIMRLKWFTNQSAGWFLCSKGWWFFLCLEITLSEDQILQTFASLFEAARVSLTLPRCLWKKLLRNLKQMLLCSLSKGFVFSRLFTVEKSKSK